MAAQSGAADFDDDRRKSGKASRSKKKDKSKAKQDKNKKKKKKGHPSLWNPVNRVIAVACGIAGSSSARSKSRSSTSLSEASSEACFDEARHLFGLKVKDLQRQSGQTNMEHLGVRQLAFIVSGALPMIPAADIYDVVGEMVPWLSMQTCHV